MDHISITNIVVSFIKDESKKAKITLNICHHNN